MVTPWGNKGVAWKKRKCKEQCQVHTGEEGHARPGWTTLRPGQDSPWKSQSEWQKTEVNGKSRSMVSPTVGSRTAKEQNRISKFIDILKWCSSLHIISSVRRSAPHRARSTNRLNPENRRVIRNVPVPRQWNGSAKYGDIRTSTETHSRQTDRVH